MRDDVVPPGRPLIVGLGGTSRPGSSSERALTLALDRCRARGCATETVVGPLLDLPGFDPTDPHRTPAALRLIRLLRECEGVIVSTPSYHGGFSGLIKNALDYTEDMARDPAPYLQDRPVGILVTAYGAQGMGTALSAMRSVVHALRGWPTPYGATIDSTAKPFAGEPPAPVVAQIHRVADQVADFVFMRRATMPAHREERT
ncbi:NADPH-dependent FMN reductase [Wenxinia marina]|uniref:Putative flavoprotein n=1 Tax=Wenxinia marina DSM 24838 TaxID=1123501 RepID=A0A0D0P9Y3_9RHOB|nr:NADPH-dependent FMN reductase [Wenxinia marina]KIQ68321.1 putative flavoprotein [Wenxinia marina DSM 24838]GGL79708.1 FMN reductase [Wenxinia marina]